MCSRTEINLPSTTSANAINNNLNKTNQHVQNLNNSKLGNVLTATSTTAASNR